MSSNNLNIGGEHSRTETLCSEHCMTDYSEVCGWDDDDDLEDTDNHETPEKEILWAAEHGEVDIVLRLLEENPSLVQARDEDGYTPLHRACYNNHHNVVDILLQHDADVAALTADNWQPLHSACKWNSVECAARLLSHGADVNAVTKGGLTPLHLASANRHARKTLELLLLNPELDATILNAGNETAAAIARRSGKHYPLFEIVEPCFNT